MNKKEITFTGTKNKVPLKQSVSRGVRIKQEKMNKLDKIYIGILTLFVIVSVYTNIYFINKYTQNKQIKSFMELNIESESVLKNSILKLQGE